MVRSAATPRVSNHEAIADCYGFTFQTARRVRHAFAISPRLSREFYLNVLSSEIRGRRECRALDAPAASHAK
jgi:hypothetical protein